MVVNRAGSADVAKVKPLETEIWKTVPRLQLSTTNRMACLVHIYPTGPGMGWLYPLDAQPVSLGRGDEADIQIHDASVSRRHAYIRRDNDDYVIIDQQSRNGTLVNDRPVSTAKLANGDLLRIGNHIFRFLVGSSVEADYHEQIYHLTISDPLTGIHNKRYLLEYLDRELARAYRYQRTLAVILFDLDQFKEINDTVGHLGGDWTLRELVRRIQGAIRKDELLARFGGEEFAVVLPESTLQGAVDMAERLRQLVAKFPFQYDSHLLQVTISLGIATSLPDLLPSPEELLRQADAKLYQAKRAGRNRVSH